MVKAKKKFGQNFLHDEIIKEKIIQAIPENLARIVEIGAGLGDLTQKLIGLDSRVDCFEIDGDLVAILGEKFRHEIVAGRLSLTHADALLAWDKIAKSEYFLVANLPYYAATNIILKALSDKNCRGFVVMVQREVGLKFCAKSGDSDFGALAILATLRGSCELLFDAPPSAFNPPPKVTSSVIRLLKRANFGEVAKNGEFLGSESLSEAEFGEFSEFLRCAFVAPRKILLKNLSRFAPKPWLENFFQKEKIPANIRPHELCVALYLKLFKEAKNERGQSK